MPKSRVAVCVMPKSRDIRKVYRIPHEVTEEVADALAQRFDLNPERVMCDFDDGTISVPTEMLAVLLTVNIDSHWAWA